MTLPTTRRQVLGGIAAAASATAIAAPVAAADPIDRVRAAWLAFCEAADEACTDGNGWYMYGSKRPGDLAGHVQPFALRLETEEMPSGLRISVERGRLIPITRLNVRCIHEGLTS